MLQLRHRIGDVLHFQAPLAPLPKIGHRLVNRAERLKDPSRREEWKAHVEQVLVPLFGTGMMMYSSAQASVQSQRIGARIRETDDFRPMTDDERFR